MCFEWTLSSYGSPSVVTVSWSLLALHLCSFCFTALIAHEKMPDVQPSTVARWLPLSSGLGKKSNITENQSFCEPTAGSCCCGSTTRRAQPLSLLPVQLGSACCDDLLPLWQGLSDFPLQPCLAHGSLEPLLMISYQRFSPCPCGSSWQEREFSSLWLPPFQVFWVHDESYLGCLFPIIGEKEHSNLRNFSFFWFPMKACSPWVMIYQCLSDY